MLLTHLGLPVYSHVCRAQETTKHSVLVPVKSCCSKKRMASECLTSGPERQGTSIDKAPCCQNHTVVAGLDSDFTFAQPLTVAKLAPALPVEAPEQACFLPAVDAPSLTITAFEPHGPPPRPWGRFLLISQQIFRC
jgi:hypothetical protein